MSVGVDCARVDRARLTNLLSRPRRVAVRATDLHARLLRGTRGRLGARNPVAPRQPVLALTTTGRRSGRRRSTALGMSRTVTTSSSWRRMPDSTGLRPGGSTSRRIHAPRSTSAASGVSCERAAPGVKRASACGRECSSSSAASSATTSTRSAISRSSYSSVRRRVEVRDELPRLVGRRAPYRRCKHGSVHRVAALSAFSVPFIPSRLGW